MPRKNILIAGATGSAVLAAVWSGDANALQAALAGRCDANNPHPEDRKGWRPLHWAAWLLRADMVVALIDGGADVNGRDRAGHTPLRCAMTYGSVSVVQRLIERGARTAGEGSVLHWAAGRGAKTVVETLLSLTQASLDVEINRLNRGGRTPLHLAAGHGHADTTSLLIASGADVNARDREGLTPLQRALEGHHRRTVDLLKAAGAIELAA